VADCLFGREHLLQSLANGKRIVRSKEMKNGSHALINNKQLRKGEVGAEFAAGSAWLVYYLV